MEKLILIVTIFGIIFWSFASAYQINSNNQGINSDSFTNIFKFRLFKLIKPEPTLTASPSALNSSQSFSQLFSRSNLSSNDLFGAVKAVLIFIINIFLVIIDAIVQVLRAILAVIR